MKTLRINGEVATDGKDGADAREGEDGDVATEGEAGNDVSRVTRNAVVPFL